MASACLYTIVVWPWIDHLVRMFFQELIQNAEDARATQVKFLHDKHSYGAMKLHRKELSQFQVYIFNYDHVK